MTQSQTTVDHLLLGPSGREARRIYFSSLLRLGFTLLRLHKLDAHGCCTCGPWSSTRLKTEAQREQYRRDGILQPCGNPGKHIVSTARKSVVSDIEEIEAHLDEGGSIGLCLRMEGLPEAPIPLLVWDCDRPRSAEWLLYQGIWSDLQVLGKPGRHVLALLPDGVPPLRSDTTSLNPGKSSPTTWERPGIDIKVSGLVVTPYSPNKRLFYKAKDISESPAEVEAIFRSMESFCGALPRHDPRELVPRMRCAENESDPTGATPENTQSSGNPRPPGKRSKRRTLSANKPSKDQVGGLLRGIPYDERKRYAQRFVYKTSAVETRNDANTFRVICTLIKRYCLSETDVLALLMKFFVPRHVDAEGKPKRLAENDLSRLILRVSEGNYIDPIGASGSEEEMEALRAELLAKVKKRNDRSNQRRLKQARNAKADDFAAIQAFLAEIEGNPLETAYAVLFTDLLAKCNAWLRVHCCGAVISRKRLGDALVHFGYASRRVRREGQMVQLVLGIRCLTWEMAG